MHFTKKMIIPKKIIVIVTKEMIMRRVKTFKSRAEKYVVE